MCNGTGYLCQIVDGLSTNTGCTGTSLVYWSANAADAEMHLTAETAGNGVVTSRGFDPTTGRLLNICTSLQPYPDTCDGSIANFSYGWDPIGNLGSRSDTLEGYVENFCYDGLNRLTGYSVGQPGAESCNSGSIVKSVSYGADGDGNVASKSDVGTYGYAANGAGPHAVTSIDTTTGCTLSGGCKVNGVSNPAFRYDANGNLTGGAGRTISYTSFNMAEQLTQGATTATLAYTPEHFRSTMATSAGTNIYLNDPVSGVVEEAFSGASTSWKSHLVADGHIVAQRYVNGSSVTMLYFTGDHLGSTSVITDSTGAVKERDSFDAWGRRRNADGTDTACSPTSPAKLTTRGYTAQEMLDSFCAINLNARVYDPQVGRIMSADPTVPDAMDGQALNRYSYVVNNPAAFIDPSGYADENDDSTNGMGPKIQPNGQVEEVVVTGDRIPTGGPPGGLGPQGATGFGNGGNSAGDSGAIETVVVTGKRLPAAFVHANPIIPPPALNTTYCTSPTAQMGRALMATGNAVKFGAAAGGFLSAQAALAGWFAAGPPGAAFGLTALGFSTVAYLGGGGIEAFGGVLVMYGTGNSTPGVRSTLDTLANSLLPPIVPLNNNTVGATVNQVLGQGNSGGCG